MVKRVLFVVSVLSAFIFAQGEQECTVYTPCENNSAEPIAVEPENYYAQPVDNSSAEEPAPAATQDDGQKPGISGFYFDMTVGASRRRFEATKVNHRSSNYNLGCHYEADGRYVCDEAKKTVDEEKLIGYTGYGVLLSAKFGGIFKSMVAPYANLELEITKGDLTGRTKNVDSDDVPKSILLGLGPGIVLYPFFYVGGAFQEFYIAGTVNFVLGGGGGIGGFGEDLMLELGYLWPVSERMHVGLAMGMNFYGGASLDDDLTDEGGYGIWLGLKIVRM